MKVSLVTASLSHLGGGVATAVQALSRSLAAKDVDIHVMGLQDDAWAADASDWSGISTTCLRGIGPLKLGFAPHAMDQLRSSEADVAHSHGIWKHTSRVVARWAKTTKRPHVVSPHGMLDAWALKHSVWKKKLAAQLYENEHLRRASCLHALCDAEARMIRKLGFENPICVIPNGVAMPPPEDIFSAPWRNTVPNGRRVMLFLGRLHPKKNLAALIKAWPSNSEDHDWDLVIAGWNEGDHEETLRSLADKRGLRNSVHFVGPLVGRKKIAAFRLADAFILPSLSEGLPMAVLEAWSYGLPVLQTDACNFQQSFCENASVRISDEADKMANDVRSFMRLTREEIAKIGCNGRRIAEQRFCWDGIAAQMKEVYTWLLDSGGKPDCVRIAGE
ncbi:MAG: glycosyltransferase [Proteobacteria bacterium]|nr:glycosyltransferase [Pseudomonadota bacterium]